MRHWRTTGTSNVANKTGSTYTSHSMTDITAIPTANLGFSTTSSAKTKLTPGDCDDNRQPKDAIWTFCSQISQFLAVGRRRNHLSNPLSSSTSSKIRNLAWEFRRYLSQFQICSYFRFWGPYQHFRLSVTIVLTCQHYSTREHDHIPSVVGILTVPFAA